jgi:hypothetical protein
MKIELSEREYGLLLHFVEMADWVLNAYTNKEDTEFKEYSELEQKIFSHAQECGYGSLIELSAEFQKYLPTRKYEEDWSVMKIVEEFENETFWDELTERLAERDVTRQIGEEHFRRLDPVDRIMKIEAFREKYSEEFTKHGIDRLVIAQPDGALDRPIGRPAGDR